MVADISDNGAGHEPLLAAIARQAGLAPREHLTLLLALATLGIVASVLAAAHEPAFAVAGTALSAAAAILCLWELLGRSHVASPRTRVTVRKGLAALGVLLWFVGGMALLLTLLGQPWQL